MRKTISLTLIALILNCAFSAATVSAQRTEHPTEVTAPVPAGTPMEFGLADGTPVHLRLTRMLSSKEVKTGDSVDFQVIDEVKLGEFVVIPKESFAIATVTQGKAAGRLGKGGKLDLRIDYLRLVSGEKIPLRAVKENRGGNRTGTMTGTLIAAGLLFFPVAPIFLFIKGKNITIPKGTEISSYIDGDYPLDREKFVAISRQAATESMSLLVKSTPEGAEIEVDGQFVGSTPSTIQVRSGEHKVSVKKAGFVVWEKVATFNAGDTITLDATLSPLP